jgi:hypothetical protein
MSSNNSFYAEASSPSSSLKTLETLDDLCISNHLQSPIEEVRSFFRRMSDSSILEYGLGIDKPNAPELAQHTTTVAMDCEKFEFEPRCLTEYGLNTFTRKEMFPTLQNPDSHNKNILQNIYFYHIRLLENAYYINRRWCPGNPEQNRFGVTRFATTKEAKDFLASCLSWPIDARKPDGEKCPVIFLGHAVNNDLDMLQKDIGINVTALSNVVAVIDTQTIANEKHIYGKGDKIGLGPLISRYGVSFRDGHTAGNDAAYITIATVQMVMADKEEQDETRSLQWVVDDLEAYSKTVVSPVGIPYHCTRCGGRDHNLPKCRRPIKRCIKCIKAGHNRAATTYITKLCTH